MAQDVSFGRYRFDVATGQLWSGSREIRLTPKATGVLMVLLTHAGQLVSREQLFASVWADTVVSDETLTSSVQELRRALADDARNPRFIETRHRRGYRFVARVSSSAFEVNAGDRRSPTAAVVFAPLPVVGRELELCKLHDCFDRASLGDRQIVFVTGEPGIGKTTFVESFLAGAEDPRARWVGQGRCIEHYGAGEAYLPILEALTRLCREPTGERLVHVLRRHAPSWLVQMPSLMTAAELETLQRQTVGVTSERMLRELAEAVEVATAERPLVLWLEDLQWSDVSTLDWLAYVARRPGRARLLLLGTYRSVDVGARSDALVAVTNELEVHGRCRELALSLLDQAAIEEYLARRFQPSLAEPSALAAIASAIWRRTEGNPLFIVNVVSDLISRGVLVEHNGSWRVAMDPEIVQVSMPESLRGMIGRRLDQVRAGERRLLEAASAAGAEFSAAAVAAAAGVPVDGADASCADLAQRELFLIALGEEQWPDGTTSGRYGFRHTLYQDVVYGQVPTARRVELHRAIGERIEAAFGDRSDELATELAMHFRRAHDSARAIRYLYRAGEIATRRGAAREAVAHLTDVLDLLNTQPASRDRAQTEVAARIALGPPLMAIRGWGAPEVEHIYARAQELCEQMGSPPELFRALWGLFQFRTNRAELEVSRSLGERLLTMARFANDSGVMLEAHHALWCLFLQGGDLVAARNEVAKGIALYDADLHASLASLYGHHDPGVCSRAIGAWLLELFGESDNATRCSLDAIALARRLNHPFSEAHALIFATFLHRERGNAHLTLQLAEQAKAIARDRGFPQLFSRATALHGWAMAQAGAVDEGIAQMEEGIAAIRRMGSSFQTYLLACLADGCRKAGRVTEALDIVTEALACVEATGERFYEAELLRMRGELLLDAGGDDAEAERCLQAAFAIGSRQRALVLQRRALKSLSDLLDRHGRQDEARRLAAEL